MESTCLETRDKPAVVTATQATAPADRHSASQRAIRWDYVIFFVALHAVALLVFVPYFFSWFGVAAFLGGVIVFGQFAIPIGYHRLLAHKSFRTPKWFERTLVTLAMCTAQETPAQWVAWHRRHHCYSDEHDDPHTPRVNFFWRMSTGWCMRAAAGCKRFRCSRNTPGTF